jgi:hypothetical protein
MRDHTPIMYHAQAYTTPMGDSTPQTCDIQMINPPNVLPNPDRQQTLCQNSEPYDIVRFDHEMRFSQVSIRHNSNGSKGLRKIIYSV